MREILRDCCLLYDVFKSYKLSLEFYPDELHIY